MPKSKIVHGYKRIERRKYPRLAHNINYIYYTPLHQCTGMNSPPPHQDLKEIQVSIINDISLVGLSFDTSNLINPGNILDCEIYLYLDYHKNIIVPISFLAKVVWIRKIDNHSDFDSIKSRLGVEFLKIKEKDRQRIVLYVEKS